MIKNLHLDPRIDKNLELMRRSGKKAALAAAKVDEIIGRLRSGGTLPDQAGSTTKHGELRIKGVVKYDLGSGYRLVSYKRGNRLFLLYVGSHDDCHRWIENNRELTVDQIQTRCARLPVGTTEIDVAPSQGPSLPAEDEFDPLASATERDLRQVFGGLAGKF